jgi:Ca-activated chloride channel family protein
MLPDLFKGSELVVVGRYGGTDAGQQRIRLTGTTRGDLKTYTYECRFPAKEWLRRPPHGHGWNDFLPRVWAVRKIGYLLDELRLHGESKELKDEVIRLSKKYGILTPYTSFLVQEDERIARRRGRAPVGGRGLFDSLGSAFARNEADMEEAAAGQAGSSGARSVAASKDNASFKEARVPGKLLREVAAYNRADDGRPLMNFIGAKTFYWENGRWVDAAYDGRATPNVLRLYSQGYYDFIQANAGVGRFFAQGDRVVLCWKGQVYETVPGDGYGGGTP